MNLERGILEPTDGPSPQPNKHPSCMPQSQPFKFTIAEVNLKPIAVMLQLMRPARASWGLLGDDWLTRMDESGRRI
jgi:hypothetical protein